jgi:hypothetical protein
MLQSKKEKKYELPWEIITSRIPAALYQVRGQRHEGMGIKMRSKVIGLE